MPHAERAWRSARFRAKRAANDVRLAAVATRLAIERRARLHDDVGDGASIAIVTWNTLPYLKTALRAIDRYTRDDVEVIVVDNASDDHTLEYLADAHPQVRVIALRRNRGHGLALDAAVHAARKRYIVTLDVDAFPISSDWLDAVIGPLRRGYTLAGALFSGYIHPCYMAIERERFLRDKHTFAASYSRRLRLHRREPRHWDAGKLITLRDQGAHWEIPPSSTRGPGSLGTVFGDLVYHHFYATRLQGVLLDDVRRSGVTAEVSSHAWEEALEKYLPTT